MELIIKAFLVHSIDNIEELNIKVDEVKAPIIKARLEYEYIKLINILKELKEAGVIKSIWIPKNKRLKKELLSVITTKRQIKNSIEKIKQVYK
jgi:hypothetical protein